MVIVALVVIIKTPDTSHANSTDNVHGFLWSDMPNGSDECVGTEPHTPDCPGATHSGFTGRGLGWISLNSDDPGAGPVGTYGVSLGTNGILSGYGWSEYGGWLLFNTPGSPYPTGPGTTAGPAHIDAACLNGSPTVCPVIGWMRFISGQALDGGWDGWISLSGLNYHVLYNKVQHTITGDAWGDSVAGWVHFYNVTVDAPVPPLTCTDTTTGQTITYQATDPMPAGCVPVPVNDVCPNNSVPDKNPELTGIQTGTGPWLGSNGTWYGPDINGDGSCDKTNDLCPSVPGTQTPSGPWSVTVNNVTTVYGLSNNICIPSVCPNHAGFYATPPTGESIIHGQCVSIINYCQQNPTLCSGGGANGPLKPIYKEN